MRENSILKKKILQYLETKDITKYEFYQKTGVSNGVLSQKNGLSEENLLRFLSYYEDISAEWLLRGRGEMLLKNQDFSPKQAEKTPDNLLLSLMQRNEELARENGQLQAENEMLKKENAHLENVVSAARATAVSA